MLRCYNVNVGWKFVVNPVLGALGFARHRAERRWPQPWKFQLRTVAALVIKAAVEGQLWPNGNSSDQKTTK